VWSSWPWLELEVRCGDASGAIEKAWSFRNAVAPSTWSTWWTGWRIGALFATGAARVTDEAAVSSSPSSPPVATSWEDSFDSSDAKVKTTFLRIATAGTNAKGDDDDDDDDEATITPSVRSMALARQTAPLAAAAMALAATVRYCRENCPPAT
jgi:hypothetical protein